MKGIDAVLLDIDGTVMDFSKGQRHAFFSAFSELGYNFKEDEYTLFDGINKCYWRKFERGEIRKDVLIYERFDVLFEKLGVKGDSAAVENIYQHYLGEQCFLIEGAMDAVKYLKGKYAIYIVTNGVKETQLNRIKKSGLINYTDMIFVSEAIGYQKPQKEFFDHVFNNVPFKKESSVIIGDSQSSDIQGGINAGIKSIWFNAEHEKKTVPSDYEIHSWEEIYKIL